MNKANQWPYTILESNLDEKTIQLSMTKTQFTYYYQVGKTRRAFLGQFLHRKHSQRPNKTQQDPTRQTKKRQIFI
jgi:hypothetical protein